MLYNTLGLKMNSEKEPSGNEITELEYLLEAAFFALSRPLRINELAEILTTKESVIRSLVKKIRRKLAKGDYAFNLDEIASDIYMMRINEKLETHLKEILKEKEVYRFSNTEIDVLTHIAYHQPIRKSDLPKMIDKIPKSKVIEALRKLETNDYVKKTQEKNTIILKTTTKFSLEFGFSPELRKLKQQLHWRLRRNT